MERINKMSNLSASGKFILLALALMFPLNSAMAQYFGRNKPGYSNFKFDVYQTPHFEIYNYLRNDSLLENLAQISEEWYTMHQKVLKDTFDIRNPMIVYNNQADFQQTRAISGLIGVGTGGVTEALKNRVIFPLAFTGKQTDHVLGHELVHAFQYHMIIGSDSTSLNSVNNLPLWMIEGMAEYLSLGSVDENTSMWMRDAILNKDFPTLKKLTRDSKYFPYRYGQAFWAMIGKTFGDTIILPLFMKSAQVGYESAIKSVLGFSAENLSGMWKSAMELHYKAYMKDSIDNPVGKKLLSVENAGRVNISPSISPDGKYVAFLSEKDIFTFDLYLADAQTGKILKKLSSTVRNDEIDDFNFVESAGTWSPDGKKFAIVIISEGINKLAIIDVKKSKVTEGIEIPGIRTITNPVWSPDGQSIVFAGMVNGQTDLYRYKIRVGNVERLTNDFTANIHPSWSSDGRQIVFSAETTCNAENVKKSSFNIAIFDLDSGFVRQLDVFPGAMNLNPVFSRDNNSIYFLSDNDGFRNLYRYDVNSGKVFRMSEFLTGISGITQYSPAIDVARNTGQLVYTYYYNNGYQIYISSEKDFNEMETDPYHLDLAAATLPPLNYVAANIVDSSLNNRPAISEIPADTFRKIPYRPNFKLDYISNIQAGVSTGRYNTGMAGAVNMIFSDILGNNQLYGTVSLNGEIFDFGGQIAYINQKRNLNWGAAVSHIPYLFGQYYFAYDTINYQKEKLPVGDYMLDLIRMFRDEIAVFSYYPLSQTRRFEAGMSLSWYYYRIDRYHNYYYQNYYKVAEKRERRPAPPGFSLQQVDFAYVADNSFFGMTAPMQGHRARYQVEKYFGEVDFFTALIDYRKYFYMKPLNLSFRVYHNGRYGNGSESNLISPLYLGYPWLIRGYESNTYYNGNAPGPNSLTINQLAGSKIVVSNLEFRLPVSGPKRYAIIPSKWLYMDLNLFFDGGLAWSKYMQPVFKWQPVSPDKSIPVFSTGTSVRINLFGYVVIEPYYAIPLQNGGLKNGSFGLNFMPGW